MYGLEEETVGISKCGRMQDRVFRFSGRWIYVCTPKKEDDLKPYITKGNHHAAAVVNTPKKEEKEATSVKDEPS
ncbi:hypothetical protein Golax_015302 [Gossypium laxum]|uniref:Uncharacterized protein n=1 Tax=Gossypium laxum TaxID=34288 RepID=A0A7J8ZXI2_9ROSI|nr:hypothetical protein [Gossypium laxum]